MADNAEFRRSGAVLNPAQRIALSGLQAASGPLTAYQVLDLLRAELPTAAPPTAYRALRRLIELGLVHRLESLNAYVACAHDHGRDPAETATVFAICDDCGRVNELSDPKIAERMRMLAESDAFTPKASVIELHGQCGLCTSEAGQ